MLRVLEPRSGDCLELRKSQDDAVKRSDARHTAPSAHGLVSEKSVVR